MEFHFASLFACSPEKHKFASVHLVAAATQKSHRR